MPPSSSRSAAAESERFAPRGRPSVLQLIVPFWISERCKVAWIQLAILLVILFGGSYLAVWGNQLLGQVTDALVGRRWSQLFDALLVSTIVGVAAVGLTVVNVAVHGLLDLEWRTWLTAKYLRQWTDAHAYYDIERDGQLSNADQRIAEDVRLFVDQTLTLALRVTTAVVQGVIYGALLWRLSGTLRFEWAGYRIAISGYMLFLSFIYTALQFLLVHWVGKTMVGLSIHKQTVEADYRFLAMQLRVNAEQIAFYDGGAQERDRLWDRFEQVRRNALEIIKRTAKVMMTQTVYSQVFHPVPTIAALPRYFAGELTMGGLTQVIKGFDMFNGTLSLVTQAYLSFAGWIAISNRLRDFSWALHKASERPRGIAVERSPGPGLTTSALRLDNPLGKVLTELAPQCFGPGERWLVRGPSGTGKSTLLRAMAGLWPFGEGSIHMPADTSMLFLPQRSYIPAGTLKAALAYPATPDAFSDADCSEALGLCGLDRLAHSLTSNEQWQQKLSGGEQQRLAIARVLLHRPAYIFLDEATSALDEAGERRVYETILAKLPGSAVISVAHRSALLAYHDKVLDLEPAARRPVA